MSSAPDAAGGPAPARPRRIVILDHTAELGGAELALLRLLAALRESHPHLSAHVILFADGPLVGRLHELGVGAEVLPLGAALGGTRRDAVRGPVLLAKAAATLPFVRRLAGRLRALDAEAVHATSLKADLLGAAAARLTGLPLIWHVHDRIAPDYLPAAAVRLLRTGAAHLPAAVIANSHATAATLPGAKGLRVAHPGLSAGQLREAPRPLPATPLVGMVGRIAPTKGQLEFVRAAASIAHRHPEATFRIVGEAAFGEGAYAAQVAAEIEAADLGDRLEVTGFVDDPRPVLDQLSLAVHCAPVPEPYGQVVAEAMARGVPVVASDAGGVREVVGDPSDGWLVPPGDVEALADAIDEALSDPVEAERRGAAGWQRARSSLTVESAAAVVAQTWEDALPRPRPRVAIAHDYLTQRGGAERVVLDLARAFPGATIHTTLYDPEATFPAFADLPVVTSPLDRLGPLRRHHRAALPLLPWAVSRLSIDADLVIASSSGWAHGVPTTGAKLVYCHAPARWLYQSEAYLGRDTEGSLAAHALRLLRRPLRRWDRRSARSAQGYLANSQVVRQRIREAYGIEAAVLPPPFAITVEGEGAAVPGLPEAGYHLVVSRLLPYKNVDRVMEAFAGLPEHLVVVGSGPLLSRLRAAAPSNVTIVSDLDDAQLRTVYRGARALVAASLEDFGLTPLEAGAFGKPVVALRAGGYLDTVIEGLNGTFFGAPTAGEIRDAVLRARGMAWDEPAIRTHVEQFSPERFAERIRDAAERVLRDLR